MKLSAIAAFAVFIALVAGSVWWVQREPGVRFFGQGAPVGENEPAPAKVEGPRKFIATPENSRPAEPVAGGRLLIADIAETTRALHSPDSTVQQDLEILQNVIEFYRRANAGSNPGGGLNEEIVDELRGRNPKRLAAIPPDHPSINARGEMLDRWGTPYWFHPIARDQLAVRSAGPDRKLWTADDVEAGNR